ncbi:MAG: hypothetical protein PHG40_04960 [Candidatus Omnitrophica bacterium]|nr:hypothetical protein [Candidatus Omnitrophota bacterium]
MMNYSLSVIRYALIIFLSVSIIGCDSFVRKFTRKTQKEDLPVEEMVLAPEEYKPPQLSPEEQYRQYFLYWQSWHDELITSIADKASQKRKIDCAMEAQENLVNLRSLLGQQAQQRLDIYINKLKELQEQIAADLYANAGTNYVQAAERIRMGIMRDFSYHKIAKDVIK